MKEIKKGKKRCRGCKQCYGGCSKKKKKGLGSG